MILRISDFLLEQEDLGKDVNPKPKDQALYKPKAGKLKISWIKPTLSEEIKHYTDDVRTEFYQHNIEISNSDIDKVKAESTKFYKYISQPFSKGRLVDLPIYSEDEFQVTKIQNLDAYEFENIVAGAYGKGYGEVMRKVSSELKQKLSMDMPAPIVIRFINFGETRRPGEASYFLFSGNRRINLALYYGIPIKVWLIDLIPSRRDVRDFAEKSGILKKGNEFFTEFLLNRTGKDNIDALSARERFNVIQSLKSFKP
jgi:hypothetical protein